MAYLRKAYQAKVQEHMSGGLSEFYKARLASKNGKTKWVLHWEREVDNLINRQLVNSLASTIRGFSDRQKAIDQVMQRMRADDSSYRDWATSVVKRDFKQRRLAKLLDDSDTNAFWDMVEAAVMAAKEIAGTTW